MSALTFAIQAQVEGQVDVLARARDDVGLHRLAGAALVPVAVARVHEARPVEEIRPEVRSSLRSPFKTGSDANFQTPVHKCVREYMKLQANNNGFQEGLVLLFCTTKH